VTLEQRKTAERLRSIDLLRGLVIVLMALDHTRDMFHSSGYAYDPLDAGHTTGVVYVTRLITHLCAPTFVFLAGVSAWLQQSGGKSRSTLSRFLVTRGVWLIFLEATVIGFGWAFSLPFLLFFQVMWAIGWAMIALAALVFFPRVVVLLIGIAVIAGHNLFDHIAPSPSGGAGWIWEILQTGGTYPAGSAHPTLLVTYPILAWIGVMALGYGLGPLFLSPRRNQLLPAIGGVLLASFFILRFWNIYGDPDPWTAAPSLSISLMHFFDVEKYPPSLLYVCATLGLVFLVMPLLDRWHGRLSDGVCIFGSVPLFAYVVHIYLLHALNVILLLATGRPIIGTFDQTRTAFFDTALLAGSGFPIAVVYAVWMVAISLLYPLCKWWAAIKKRNRTWWMAYL
jgi:uncharacterized membrane protein